MLSELWTQWRTPASPVAKKMGFVYEAVALQSRLKSHRSLWEAHLRRSKNAIKRMVESCEQHHLCVILGSGLWADVPVEYLSRRFEEVWLVDIVHLPQVRKKVQTFENVQLMEWDVTESLATWLSIDEGELRVAQPTQFLGRSGIDLVVSVNILTQLSVLPVHWLRKETSISEAQIEQIHYQLLKAHVDYLHKFSGQVGLLTEFQDESHALFDKAWLSEWHEQTQWQWPLNNNLTTDVGVWVKKEY